MMPRKRLPSSRLHPVSTATVTDDPRALKRPRGPLRTMREPPRDSDVSPYTVRGRLYRPRRD